MILHGHRVAGGQRFTFELDAAAHDLQKTAARAGERMILATSPAVDCRGLLSNSLVEWEGRLAAVVFTLDKRVPGFMEDRTAGGVVECAWGFRGL